MYEVFYNDNLIILNSEDVYLRDFGRKIKLTNPRELVLFLDEYFTEEVVGDILLYGYLAEEMFTDFSTYFKYLEAAGGIVENPSGELLFIKRLGVWDFPKGKIEKSETAEGAAVREVEEETGVGGLEIEKEISPTYHIYFFKEKFFLKKTFWFKMQTNFSGNLIPQTDEDIELAEWHKKTEAKQLLDKSYRSLRESFRELFDDA